MPVPALPAPDLVVIESDLVLGELEDLLDRPARACHPHDLRQGGVDAGVDQVIGPFIDAQRVAAHKHGVELAARTQGGPQRHVRPVIGAGTLRTFPATQPQPGRRRHRRGDVGDRCLGGQSVRRPGG